MNCLDKKKFSGHGRKKQCCVERKCKNLVHPNKAHIDVSSPQDNTTSLIVDQGTNALWLLMQYTHTFVIHVHFIQPLEPSTIDSEPVCVEDTLAKLKGMII